LTIDPKCLWRALRILAFLESLRFTHLSDLATIDLQGNTWTRD